MEFAWWHWLVLGIILMLLELAIPAFFIIWFGIGALVVGVAMLLFNLPLSGQLFLWTIASGLMVFGWFRYFKLPDRTKAGLSREAFIGQRGMITREVSELTKGEIRFQSPILGSEKWPVISDETIPSGERARIIDVIGQTLKVAREN
jgi:membrane protein implicated in regulation of membrane protease activity